MWQLGDERRRWRYRISADAPVSWTDATLTYRMHESIASQIVQAEFERGETRSTFRLGYFVKGHESHADMRFPGFFMLPVYLDGPLEDGARFSWQTPWPLNDTRGLREQDAALATGWMWHLPQLLLEPDRVKRYAAHVRKWDELDTPLGKVAAACIEATVSYVQKGRTVATTRQGRLITAELIELQPPPFDLVDMRPNKDKMSHDPGDGSFVAGDAEFSPERLSLLRQHLNAVASAKLAGRRVEVGRLVTSYVRTPKAQTIERGGGLAPMPAEEYFDLPKLRSFPFWVICFLELHVDGRRLHGRGVVGFGGDAPDFARHHRQALVGAINQAIQPL